MISLQFHGAAQTVTGSKHLLTCGEDRLLVDCGQFQGLKELRLKNWEPPAFDPKTLPYVALTHCHIDHCGYLPCLVRHGFKGKVLCTAATADLLPIVLMDAAKLQEEDAQRHNEEGTSKHSPAMPLFTQEDVAKTLRLLQPVDYDVPTKLGNNLTLRFLDVGHILGSAMIQVAATDAGRTVQVVFSGDVGRYNMPLPPDPVPPPECDYILTESTYGDRHHSAQQPEDELEAVVKLAVQAGGILLVPAFAVGRSQQLLFMLRELSNAGRIPRLPIHVDSPMAFDTTAVYLKYLQNHKVKMDAIKGGGGIMGPDVKLHRSQQESRALADLKGPAVVISSSGMLAGGRILHHVANFMPRASTVLALAGYQAEGTRGRLLLEGRPTLKIFGVDVPMKGKVVDMAGFSGHADSDELMRWLGGLPRAPKKVFITHGEPSSAKALGERITKEKGWPTAVPAMHEEAVL